MGIGANTAIFSVIDSILLQPLPFPHAGRLVEMDANSDYASYPKGWVREYQRRATTFAAISAYTLNAEFNVAGAGSSDRAFGSSVSTNLFDTLGVRSALGRFFTAPEEALGQDRVVVLNHAYWQQRFGSDPSVLGKNILVDGVNRQIIGVAPKGIQFPDAETQFWIPISFMAGDIYDPWAVFGFRAIGRLKEDAGPSLAQAELRSFHSQMLTLFPWRMPDNWAANVTVTPMLQAVVGDIRPKLLLLLGAVGLVLLIACANVANLMLARAASRQREMALRTALGADSRRLVRQLLTESGVLAALSGAAGVIFAAVGLQALKLALPPDTPRLASVSLHGDVLLFAAVVSLLAGVLSGLAPAWNAASADLQGPLKLNETNVFGTARRFRVSRLLVVGQIALAVVVITAAGVMLRSLSRLSNTDPGFRTDRIVSAQVSLDRNACAKKGACAIFYQSLLDRALGLPGATGTALVDVLPLTGFDTWYVFDAEGHPRSPRQLSMEATSRIVSSDYLKLMSIPLQRGRLFLPSDASGSSRAIIVNASLANYLWPNQDPIGKHLMSVDVEPSPAVMDMNAAPVVVGVVADTRHESLDKGSGWEVYLPMSPGNEKPVMNIVVRSNAGSGEIAGNLRRMVAEIDPAIPVTKVRTMDEVVAASTSAPRSLTMLLTAFAVLAIGVGSIGVYSLIAYTVSWRTREFGLRLALGANRMQVAMLIIRQSLGLTAAGSVLGIAAAFAVTRLMRRFLFETSPADPLTYALVPLLFAALSIVAAWLPARRAAQVEPMEALRND
ncbi:MAG: ABC transporter permease [Ignavibacteriota bacterium]